MIDLNGLQCKEKKAMEELRTRVESALDPDLLEDNSLIYRFLKARDFDVDKGEKMLRKHIIWRKANQMHNFLQDFKAKEVYVKLMDPSVFGVDKDGDIIAYAPSGKYDIRNVLKCITLNDFGKHIIWTSERNKSILLELNRKVQGALFQMSMIIDLDKLTFGNATNKSSSEIFIRLLHVLQDNYPEGLKNLYVINAPGYSLFVISILKAMMSNAMLRKMHVFGRNGWKEKLLEHVDANVLPAFLGGNRTDPDGNPKCTTFIIQGGNIPSCYYLSNEDRYFKDKTKVTTINVPLLSKREVYVNVNEAESVIKWEFLVKNKDIGFGLFFGELEEKTNILPIQRFDTTDGVESGSHRAKFSGIYIITFDNSYSWLSSKEIEYCVKVTKPGS